MSAGTVTTGGVVSWIVIVADFDTVVLSSVVVWHVTVVAPRTNCAVTLNEPEPDVPAGMSHVAGRGAPVPGSNAFTLYVASAPFGPVASAVTSDTRSAGGGRPAPPALRARRRFATIVGIVVLALGGFAAAGVFAVDGLSIVLTTTIAPEPPPTTAPAPDPAPKPPPP